LGKRQKHALLGVPPTRRRQPEPNAELGHFFRGLDLALSTKNHLVPVYYAKAETEGPNLVPTSSQKEGSARREKSGVTSAVQITFRMAAWDTELGALCCTEGDFSLQRKNLGGIYSTVYAVSRR